MRESELSSSLMTWISTVDVAGVVAAWLSCAIAAAQLLMSGGSQPRKRPHRPRPSRQPSSGVVGDDNTIVGDGRPVVGSGNTIIGATDDRGNTIIRPEGGGWIAIGAGAYAGPGSISIGAGAGGGDWRGRR
jgi:hypothetical protein